MAGDQHQTQNEAGEFELPLPDEGSEGRRLRRRLFGYRPGDVAEVISSKQEEIAILQRDVAALWLAFSQHERTIRTMLEAIEALGGERLDPPGARSPRRPDAGGREEDPDQQDPDPQDPAAVGEPHPSTPGAQTNPEATAAQLAGLDEVLAAIEHATQSLEQAYAEEVAATEEQEEQVGTEDDDPEEDAETSEQTPD